MVMVGVMVMVSVRVRVRARASSNTPITCLATSASVSALSGEASATAAPPSSAVQGCAGSASFGFGTFARCPSALGAGHGEGESIAVTRLDWQLMEEGGLLKYYYTCSTDCCQKKIR